MSTRLLQDVRDRKIALCVVWHAKVLDGLVYCPRCEGVLELHQPDQSDGRLLGVCVDHPVSKWFLLDGMVRPRVEAFELPEIRAV